MKTATPKGSRLNNGGQGQNRTADTRIFSTRQHQGHTTSKPKVCNKNSRLGFYHKAPNRTFWIHKLIYFEMQKRRFSTTFPMMSNRTVQPTLPNPDERRNCLSMAHRGAKAGQFSSGSRPAEMD
jgi:hypothetical protein